MGSGMRSALSVCSRDITVHVRHTQVNHTLLIISQVYVPDPAAVGQHITDVAEEMVRRGWKVVVYTSSRGYDDPRQHFPGRENRNGVDIRRIPFSSFGKASIAVRLIAQSLFIAQAMLRSLFVPRVSAVLVSTSPPFAGFAGAILAWCRRVPFVWWVMDLNPDQMVVVGKLAPNSRAARLFDWMNGFTLKRAAAVIALDTFMAERLLAKHDCRPRLHVIPPWAHENHLQAIPHEENPFRLAHGFGDRFVVMYSGNAGITSPLDTLLSAAAQLRDDPRILFVFIGGGTEKKKLDEMLAKEKPTNIVCLPYQPLDQIRYSLSAADIHVVSIADEAVGVVHPCKIYGAMALGKPVLALGPARSHVGEIIARYNCGWVCSHGEPAGVASLLRDLAGWDPSRLSAVGARGRSAVDDDFSHSRILDQVCTCLQTIVP